MSTSNKVLLIKMPKRKIEKLKLGMVGELITCRPSDGQMLVKWEGKSGRVSHSPDQVKKITWSQYKEIKGI